MSKSVLTPLPAEVVKAMKIPEKVFGRYILLQELGRGGMGTVQKAWQMDLKRYVAIKFLHSTGDTQQLKRFYREAQTAAQLSHPNITSIYEISIQDDRHFICMEYIDGHSFDDIPPPTDSASLRKIIFWMRDVARAVHTAHTRGVIHRDLKPGNIMLNRENKPFVTDFGLARHLDRDIKITKTGLVVGTPAFMSPEQAQYGGEDLDGRTDVWSLGATLYDLVSGRPPFKGPGPVETLSMVVHSELSSPAIWNPIIPKDLEAIIMKSLQKKRDARYDSALEMAKDLDRYLRGIEIMAKAPTFVSKGVRFAKKRKVSLSFGGLILLAGGIWLGSVLKTNYEIDLLYQKANQFYKQKNWAECLRIAQRIEEKGGRSPLVRKYISDSQSHLNTLTETQTDIILQQRSQSHSRLAGQKLREVRSLMENSGIGYDQVHSRYQELIQVLMNSLDIYPKNQDALFTLVEAYNDLRDPKGIPFSETLVKLTPSDPITWLHSGRLRLWRYIRETGLIDDSLIQDPDFDRISEGNRILDHFEKAISLGISGFHKDLATGLKWFIEGDMEGAWTAFDKAFENNPGNRDLSLFRALCSRFVEPIHGNMLPRGENFIEKAYKVQPYNLYTLYPYLMLTLYRDPDIVAKLLPSMTSVQSPVMERIRFESYRVRGKSQEAGKLWNHITNNSLDPWAIYTYAQMESTANLEKILILLLQSRKKHPLWEYFIDDFRARILGRLDRLEEAKTILSTLLKKRFFDRLAAHTHEESRLHGSLAAIEQRKKNYDKAIQSAMKSISFFPRPHSYLVLAGAWFGKKDYQKAIDIAEKGLRIISSEKMPGLNKKFRELINQANKWLEYENQ